MRITFSFIGITYMKNLSMVAIGIMGEKQKKLHLNVDYFSLK